MRNLILFSLFLFSISACEWEGSTTSYNNGFTRKLTEDQVINNTMNDFIREPNTQDEVDRNIILNYIIDNKLEMESTPEGIYYQITRQGTGDHPTIKDDIVVHYHGTLLNGKVFDSTRGKSFFTYPLKRMIDGWQKGIPLMKTGSKAIFIIPSSMCYGENGFNDLIPPHSILKFEIELLGIK